MHSIPKSDKQLRAEISTRYAQKALQVLRTEPAVREACCGPDCCTSSTRDTSAITSDLYSQMELGLLPLDATLASLGCGNPTALAELQSGENVLDLGSGGGIDVLLSAQRIGPTGMAYGLDMTDAMLDLAERNRQEAGIENVRFLKGIIEAIPLKDSTIDVVISNCVLNLSVDKGQVLREAYRVLVPGGRLAISDIIVQGQLPPELRLGMEAWAGCIAGALEEETYQTLLSSAGFIDIRVDVTRRYHLGDIAESEAHDVIMAFSPNQQQAVNGTFVSAFIRARKL